MQRANSSLPARDLSPRSASQGALLSVKSRDVVYDVAALASQLEADQSRLDELAGLYAEGAVSAREWIAARDPINDRITQARRDIAQATDTSSAGVSSCSVGVSLTVRDLLSTSRPR